ncbi:glycosyltransferase family 4 protein [Planctomycetaceae bacterium SH139]
MDKSPFDDPTVIEKTSSYIPFNTSMHWSTATPFDPAREEVEGVGISVPTDIQRTVLSEIFPPRHGGSGRYLYEVYRRQPLGTTLAVVDQLREGDQKASVEDDSWIRRVPFTLPGTGSLTPGGLIGYWRLLRKIQQSLGQQQPRMIHVARVLPEGWLAYLHYLRTGTPFVCFAHGEEINLDGARGGGVMSSRQHRWMTRRVVTAARHFIANSHNTARMLTDQWHLPASSISVLHPGVDCTQFRPAYPDFEFRSSHGWIDRVVLLTVGRLQARKGQDQLIRALPEIRKVIPNVLYAIVGHGEELEHLKSLAAQVDVNDHVQFLVNVDADTLPTYYQQCDLFVLPNRQIGSDVEGFGMVLLEAQACGKAVVAGRSGGTCEAMQDGVTGFSVDATNLTELTTVIVRMLQDPSKLAKMATTARSWVESRFDWSVVARTSTEFFAKFECPSAH